MIGLVIFVNLQCALEFIAHPGRYAPAFELTGAPGNAAIQGFGLLFVMWNVPYLFAASHPVKYRFSLIQALIMQSIGLAGETWIYYTLPVEHTLLQASVLRFILFDFAGLLLLFVALLSIQKLSLGENMFTTIISTVDLAKILSAPNLVVVDCRFDLANPDSGFAQYQEGHIPGAVYAHLNRDLSSEPTPQTGRHPLPDPVKMARCFSEWGIDDDKQVVVYDTAGGSMAARLWGLLKYYRFNHVAILDGSFTRWTSESRPVEKGVHTNQPAVFTARMRDDFLASLDEVNRIRLDPQWKLVDARSEVRFRGEEELIDPVAGHIPGAINRFHGLNLSAEGVFKPADQLKKEFLELLGSTPANRTIVYCGSGVTSIHHLVAMEYAGLPGARVYPGSWSEWIRDPSRPIATK